MQFHFPLDLAQVILYLHIDAMGWNCINLQMQTCNTASD